jgi:hypothetical protein
LIEGHFYHFLYKVFLLVLPFCFFLLFPLFLTSFCYGLRFSYRSDNFLPILSCSVIKRNEVSWGELCMLWGTHIFILTGLALRHSQLISYNLDVIGWGHVKNLFVFSVTKKERHYLQNFSKANKVYESMWFSSVCSSHLVVSVNS